MILCTPLKIRFWGGYGPFLSPLPPRYATAGLTCLGSILYSLTCAGLTSETLNLLVFSGATFLVSPCMDNWVLSFIVMGYCSWGISVLSSASVELLWGDDVIRFLPCLSNLLFRICWSDRCSWWWWCMFVFSLLWFKYIGKIPFSVWVLFSENKYNLRSWDTFSCSNFDYFLFLFEDWTFSR